MHLLAVAGSCRRLVAALECRTGRQLTQLVQAAVGERYVVTGNAKLIEADEDENKGGRRDDAVRARDLQAALADDRVAAAVSLRGGSWLTRILPLIDFDVLKKRRKPISIFGFSELTTVINITARYPIVRAYYDMGPAFLRAGIADAARTKMGKLAPAYAEDERLADAFASGFAAARFQEEFASFFKDVVRIAGGGSSERILRAEHYSGDFNPSRRVTFVGGTLSVLTPLIGTPYAPAIDPKGRWLALEDINEAPYRVDRALAHLRLAGFLPQFEGFLIGDFHEGQTDRVDAVLALLIHHLGPKSRQPILLTRDMGHIWPMAPLPIGRPMRWQSDRQARRQTYRLLG